MSGQQTDDAPLTASKSRGAVEEAAGTLAGNRGDTLTGWSVTVNRPAADLFAFFRNFANLPQIMDNIERIDVLNEQRSHWVVKAPGGTSVEWTSAITAEKQDSFIAWASEKGADVSSSGRVDFRPAGDRGTVVTATILYDPPFGAAGKLIAKLFQRDPTIQARRDLRRFKQLMETGEIATAARTKKQLEEEKA